MNMKFTTIIAIFVFVTIFGLLEISCIANNVNVNSNSIGHESQTSYVVNGSPVEEMRKELEQFVKTVSKLYKNGIITPYEINDIITTISVQTKRLFNLIESPNLATVDIFLEYDEFNRLTTYRNAKGIGWSQLVQIVTNSCQHIAIIDAPVHRVSSQKPAVSKEMKTISRRTIIEITSVAIQASLIRQREAYNQPPI
jgi:hypothetical protein